MTLTEDQRKKFEEMRKKTSSFIKEVAWPIKQQHGEEIEKYLDRFIKFPALASIASILFASSDDFVKNPKLAILGMVIILISSLWALNIFRMTIQKDKKFINKIKEIEDPMVKFGTKLTVFSRDQVSQSKLEDLMKAYDDLENSYTEDSLEGYNDNADLIYKHVNISFGILVLGVFVSVLSIINFC